MADVWDALVDYFSFASPAVATYNILDTVKDAVLGGSDGGTTSKDPEDVKSAKKFLYVEAAILGGAVALPMIYAAVTDPPKGSKAKKKDERLMATMYNASNRATTLLAAFGPSILMPLSYITVQKLEDAQFISKGLGDTTQTLIATMAVAPVAGVAINAATKLITKK